MHIKSERRKGLWPSQTAESNQIGLVIKSYGRPQGQINSHQEPKYYDRKSNNKLWEFNFTWKCILRGRQAGLQKSRAGAYGDGRSKELEVGRSGHGQGIRNKYLDSAERGEHSTDLDFFFFLIIQVCERKFLRFFGTFESSGMDGVGFHNKVCWISIHLGVVVY